MYTIHFMTFNNEKGVITLDSAPIAMPEEDAWEFIQTRMALKEHPKFMWLEEVDVGIPAEPCN